MAVVFVAILPYSQYIYAEGMLSTKEPHWIDVNNHALDYFGGVPAIVICDNCKQAVIANKDWITPELNKDYAEWAEHNQTVSCLRRFANRSIRVLSKMQWVF